MAINEGPDETTPFVQLLFIGGWVQNFEVADFKAEVLPKIIDYEEDYVEFRDLYGDECGFYTKHVIGWRTWTPEGAEVYRRVHRESKETFE